MSESFLSRVRKLRGVAWEWAPSAEQIGRTPGQTDYGVIAQELQAVFPYLVHEQPSGHLAVNYTGIIAVLIEALKELSERVERLEQPVPDD